MSSAFPLQIRENESGPRQRANATEGLTHLLDPPERQAAVKGTRTSANPMAALNDILSRCIQQGDCWVWTGAGTAQGYGRVLFDGAVRPTHRVVYTLMVADIPDGLHIDHLCRVKACQNPYHMDPVTPAVNNQRSMPWRDPLNFRRERPSHCQRGHEFTPENTINRANGRRMCRACTDWREETRRMRRRKRL